MKRNALAMFRRFGIVSLRRGANSRGSGGIRNNHSFNGSANRYQSSFTFLNNQSLLQKDELKQSKRKNRKSFYKNEDEEEQSKLNKCTVELSTHMRKPKKHDYSWLPRVPSTGFLKPRDVSTKVLYSGYRPLFINPDKSDIGTEGGQGGSTLYEFAMKLEDLSDQTPWMTSAAGMEFYSEWDNIPVELRKNLKPFEPPVSNENVEDTEMSALRKLKEEIYLNERAKLINRSKGRKKPVVTLMRLKKKLDEGK